MPNHIRLLVVDRDEARALSLVELLVPAGYEVRHAASADGPGPAPDLVVLSVDTADGTVVAATAAAAPEAAILVVTSAFVHSRARDAVTAGAREVVPRDAGGDVILIAAERAAREGRDHRELTALRARLADEAREALVGGSAPMVLVRELVGRAASSHRTVLITGEPGSGKSTVARLIHDLSERAARPFVLAHCETIGSRDLEVELFGGAREGLIERARGGTLVLEEAGMLSRALYARIARMLTERSEPVGRVPSRPADVRLMLTMRTSADAGAADARDLIGDRTALRIALPPLRERRRDIPLLVHHLRRQFAPPGTVPAPLGSEAMAPLLAHDWPGNVRELEHRVARMALEQGTPVRESFGAQAAATSAAAFAPFDAERLTLEALERRYILHVLDQEGGHQSRAADRLGIDRRTLYRKLKEYRDQGVIVRAAG